MSIFYFLVGGLLLWLVIALLSNWLNNRALREIRKRNEGRLNETMSHVSEMAGEIAGKVVSR